MERRGFEWWTRRLRSTFNRFDLVRLDHFRGFERYWEIPAERSTAIKGQWKDGPGAAFFRAMEDEFDDLPLVAEDLGIITGAVEALRDTFEFPGMAVLQFAFGGNPANEFLPHNYERNLVAYPGTHDNNTTVGWWTEDLSAEGKEFARSYLDPSSEGNIHRHAFRALMASVANRVITPLQDVLGLGSEARMNTPGAPDGNWTWRFTPDQISDEDEDMLKELTYLYGRASSYD
jgi:4-alpha-glucanotransferase